MVIEIVRALGLIAAGVLLVIFFAREPADRDDAAWFDADWEQPEERDR